MKHAVVTTSAYLLRVNLVTKEVVPVEGHRTEYYGVSWFAGDSELTLSHSGLDNDSLQDLVSYADSEVGWISSKAGHSRKFLSQPHQILCAPDGRVVCTNTGRNVITVIDPAKPGTYQEAGLGSARWDRLALDSKPGDHLNSVFIRNGELFVIAHRFDKGSMLIRLSYPDLETIEVRSCGWRTGLHNIWATDDNRYISCHSEAGALVDLAEDTLLWSAGSAIYTRGLAACRDYVVIGESQRSGRDLRRSSIGGLWILDRSTWQAVDHISLGPYGAVHEVRLLDVPDEAHHSHVFYGLQQLLERDMRSDMSSARLASTRAVLTAAEAWRDFELMFGASEALPDGAKRAGAESLCLAIRKTGSAERPLTFRYSLEGPPGAAHVSAIFDYHGFGGDTRMTAVLLQPVGSTAALSVWRHDGETWSLKPEINAENLPLSSSFSLAVSNGEIAVAIGNIEIFRASAESFGVTNNDIRLGIRWIGATVLPGNNRFEDLLSTFTR
ncbi:hypothetical protein EGT07_11740 [Herbaspirillum sp. HC18]|nr:hypothetical protein EGT07_11740 [Herbaspirillum sp. HC18]